MITIDFEKCKGCGLCKDNCPRGLISMSEDKHNQKGYYPAVISDQEKCVSCALCAVMCPDCAIKVEKGE